MGVTFLTDASPDDRQLAWAGALAAWVLALGCRPIALEDVHKHCSTENAGRVCASGFSRFAK